MLGLGRFGEQVMIGVLSAAGRLGNCVLKKVGVSTAVVAFWCIGVGREAESEVRCLLDGRLT